MPTFGVVIVRFFQGSFTGKFNLPLDASGVGTNIGRSSLGPTYRLLLSPMWRPDEFVTKIYFGFVLTV
jgi:hypothetical protein